MKKLLTIIILLIAYTSFAQPEQTRSSSSVTVVDAFWKAKSSMGIPVFADTLSGTVGLDSCGKLIYTYTGNKLWLRGCSPKRWIDVTGSGGGGLTTASNGLNVVGTDVRLGGTMNTGATTIDANNAATLFWTNFSDYYITLQTGAGHEFVVSKNSVDRFRADATNTRVNSPDGTTSQLNMTQAQAYMTSSAQLYLNGGNTWFGAVDSIIAGVGTTYPNATSGYSIYPSHLKIYASSYQDQYAPDSLIWRISSRDAFYFLSPGFAHIYSDDSTLVDNDNGYYRFTHLTTGTTSDKVALFDANGKLKQIAMSSIVGAVPTLQQVTTAGGTATGNNVVITGGSTLQLYSSVNNGIDFNGSSNKMVIEANAGDLQISSAGTIKTQSALSVNSSISLTALLNNTSQDRLVGIVNSSGVVGNLTVASPLNITSGVLGVTAGAIPDSTTFVNKTGPQVISGIKDLTNGIVFGGVTSSFPKLVNSNADLQLLLADGSGYASLIAAGIKSGSTTFNLATTNATLINIGDANAAVISFGGGTSGAKLVFQEPSASGSNVVGFIAPALAGDITFTLPNAFPAGTYLMNSTNAGVMGFTDPASLPYWKTSGTTTLAGSATVNGAAIMLGGTGPQGLKIDATSILGDYAINQNGTTVTADDNNNYILLDNTAHTALVGINNPTPTANFEVWRGGTQGLKIDGAANIYSIGDVIGNNNSQRITIDDAGSTIIYNSVSHSFEGGTVTVLNLAGTGSRAVLADASGVLSAPVSDFSVKKNVKGVVGAIDKIMALRPVTFEYIGTWQNRGAGTQIGFIAQNIQSVLPNSTFMNKPTGKPGDPLNGVGKMGYNEQDIIPLLVSVAQSQQIEIENLKAEIIKLKKR